MDYELRGRRVIVTGASRGIGRGIAEAFAGQGASVSICGRNEKALAAAHASVAAYGGTVHSRICDLADGDAVGAYIEAAADALGGVDTLINNASGFGRADSEEGWAAAIEVDLMATIRAGWAALPWLRRSSHYPSIVHITSNVTLKASVMAPAYAAIKAALVHFSRSQAKTLAREGIRVNTVGPGSTTAPGHFFEKRREAGDPSYAQVLATIPAGRLGTPDEIAQVVMFLASAGGRWVNGQTIIADGGQFLFDNT